jgi:anaerobic magnesium-protoporphyrin IX monomethyl ester cyclase
MSLDALFVNADSSTAAYQGLAENYSAIEPPTWSLLLAQSCRSIGFDVAIVDSTAEKMTHEKTVERIIELKPRIVVFVVYGQNPNSGTTNMIGNSQCATLLKASNPEIPIVFVGSHASALPKEVLNQDYVDIVLLNEGVYALHNLLQSDLAQDLRKIKGIGHKLDGLAVLNPPERVVPTERMDIDLPGYAWDLLPYDKKPLDLYRSHFWHAKYQHQNRSPFAAIYTSLGCRFKCDFCMINIVNRVDNDDLTVSSHSPNMRFWSPDFIIGEFEKLANYGVTNLRISDEMFFLNQRYFEPLLEDIVNRDYKFNMWAYTRVDTVRERYLELFRRAGMEWLAVGIEAGNRDVRREVSKGTFQIDDIGSVIGLLKGAGINIAANYIFGFPEDNFETMNQTLDLAIELNTEMANMYPCQALPGSPIYQTALQNNWTLPSTYEGYAFLSYESTPLPTKFVSAADVLQFRDSAWQTYHTNPNFLNLIENKFGIEPRENIENLAKVKLKRKLLGD